MRYQYEEKVYSLELAGHEDTILVGGMVLVATLGCFCPPEYGWNAMTRKTRPCLQQDRLRSHGYYLPAPTSTVSMEEDSTSESKKTSVILNEAASVPFVCECCSLVVQEGLDFSCSPLSYLSMRFPPHPVSPWGCPALDTVLDACLDRPSADVPAASSSSSSSSSFSSSVVFSPLSGEPVE